MRQVHMKEYFLMRRPPRQAAGRILWGAEQQMTIVCHSPLVSAQMVVLGRQDAPLPRQSLLKVLKVDQELPLLKSAAYNQQSQLSAELYEREVGHIAAVFNFA